jgi:hypothetical protein
VGIEVESTQPGQINWTEFKVIAVDSGAVFGFWSNGVASAQMDLSVVPPYPLRS